MTQPTITDAVEPWHPAQLIDRLAPDDRDELDRLSQGRPLWALLAAVNASDRRFCALDGAGPILIGGALKGGMVWMLAATPEVERHKRWFLRESRARLPALIGPRARLHAKVDARYAKSIRWLRWLGFEVCDPVDIVIAGHRRAYCEVEITK